MIGGIVISAEDISSRLVAERALAETQAILFAALESTTEGIFISNAQGRIIHVNQAAVKLLKAPDKNSLMIDLADYEQMVEAYQPDGTLVSPDNVPPALALRGEQRTEVEYRLRLRHTGETFDVTCSFAPIRNQQGEIVGSILVGHDVTARKEAEARKRGYSEERLRVALDAARMGTWEWDLKRRLVIWDSRQFELFGMPEVSQHVPIELVFEKMHPEDRDRIGGNVTAAQQEHVPFQDAFRVLLADGKTRWLGAFGLTYSDSNGIPERTVGVNFDVTEQKEAELELQRREARLRAVFENAFLAILTVDNRGVIESANQAVQRMFGYAPFELAGRSISTLFPAASTNAKDSKERRLLRSGLFDAAGESREFKVLCQDGSLLDVVGAVSAIDQVGLFTVTLLDVSRQKQLEREVVEIASQEQHRIGRDLHDTVAQNVAGLYLMACKLAENLVNESSPHASFAAEIAAGLEQTKFEIRSILGGLIPVSVERQGLTYALGSLANRVHQPGRMACLFECAQPIEMADHLVATHLFLIAQEAVLNAVKPSHASEICIILFGDENNVVLSVRDNGRGVAADGRQDQGVGTRIMLNRAAIIGASLTTESIPNRGTTVICRLPIG